MFGDVIAVSCCVGCFFVVVESCLLKCGCMLFGCLLVVLLFGVYVLLFVVRDCWFAIARGLFLCGCCWPLDGVVGCLLCFFGVFGACCFWCGNVCWLFSLFFSCVLALCLFVGC